MARSKTVRQSPKARDGKVDKSRGDSFGRRAGAKPLERRGQRRTIIARSSLEG